LGLTTSLTHLAFRETMEVFSEADEMDLGLTGRVAIVAAASKGLGRAVAEELAREGAHVAICARTASTLAETAAHIRKTTGREVLQQALDVTDSEAVTAFVGAVDARFGRVDICVTKFRGASV
jgi:3-oxoacyl-[acyl-carrier protein] reductase